MSEEEKKAIEWLKIEIDDYNRSMQITEDIDLLDEYAEQLETYESLLNLIEKKDKMIDKMAEYLADMDFDECCAEIPEPCFGCSWEDYEPHTNCIKEHFRNEVLKDE